MKKLIMLMLGIFLVSCAPGGGNESGLPYIVTTSYPLYDFAREVAAEDAMVELLLPPGAEVHSYEVTPADIKKITRSDLFLYIGGSSDAWMDSLLEGAELSPTHSLRMMDVVELFDEEQSQSMVEEEDHEDIEYDEHIWLSLPNSRAMVQAMAQSLALLDPEHEENYRKRAQAYTNRLDNLDERFVKMVSASKRKEIVVGDRFPFLYLVKHLGLSYDAAYPGCSAHVEENAKAIKGLIDRVKEEAIPVVFTIEMSRGTIADRIVEATGAEKRMLHSIQNITKEEMQRGENFLSLMEKNLAVLEEALN